MAVAETETETVLAVDTSLGAAEALLVVLALMALPLVVLRRLALLAVRSLCSLLAATVVGVADLAPEPLVQLSWQQK